MKRIIDIIQKRDEIVNKHCKEKGWDVKNLSCEQILEIRALLEWQNAGKEIK